MQIKKGIILAGIISGILLLVFFIWGLNTDTQNSFKNIKIDKTTNIIYNATDMEFIDTILYVGLKEMNLSGLTITVRLLTSNLNLTILSDLKFKICSYPNDFTNKACTIFIKKMGRISAIEAISHELTHIKQFYTTDLILKNDSVIWKGDTILLNNLMDYNNRPWEIEAYTHQNDIKYKLLSELY